MANRPVSAKDDIDAIPMKKSNPMVVFGIIGSVLLIALVIGFTSWRKKSEDAAVKAAAKSAAAVQAQGGDGMTAEERKQHIEITRKSLERVATDEAAKKKVEEEVKAAEAAKASEGSTAPPPAGGPVAKAPTGPAVPAAAAPEPPPKKPSAATKKTASDLAGLEAEIGKIK